MAYAKRWPSGFNDSGLAGGTPADSAFLNAVEAALLALFDANPGSAGMVPVWTPAGTHYVPQLITNASIDPAAAIAKSKLAALNITDADIAGAAAIAKSKLALAGSLTDADINAAAAIVASKLAGYPADVSKGLAGDGSWQTRQYPWAHVRHSVASGTDGGGLTATTWNTRPCAEVTDVDGILSVASNQMTLTAGTYRVHIAAVGFHGSGRVGTRLRNVTDSTTVLVGTAGYAVDSEWVSIISGQFTIASGKALEIQHWPGVAQAGNGMGASVGDGEAEVYMQGEFWKVA